MTSAAMKRAMATATRKVGNKEGNGNSGKNNYDGNKVGGYATASRVMATAMAMATGGQWQQQRGWQVTTRARTRAARLMVDGDDGDDAMGLTDPQNSSSAHVRTGGVGFLLTTELGGGGVLSSQNL